MTHWRVAHVITHLELGGAQLATLSQISRSRFFAGSRTLITGGGRLLERARALPGVWVVTIPELARRPDPLRDARALRKLIAVLRRPGDGPLLVHTHSPKAGVLGRIAARAAGAAKVIHSVHGFGHGHGGSVDLFGWMERSCARLADGYTTDSAANRRQGLAEGLFADRPVEVVHCGVDLGAFRFDPLAGTRVRDALGIDYRTPLIVTLANFKPQKDPLTWVRVVDEVARADATAVFAFAGDGPLRPEVERAVRERGLSERVRLLGWRDDAPALLGAADLFLLTSRWEGLPQSFGQAMAAGLPIVATDVDGAPEAVEDGVTGFLRPAGDAPALAEAVLTLIRSPRDRDRMGERARQRAAKFSEARMVATLDRFYAQVTGASPAPLPPPSRGSRPH